MSHKNEGKIRANHLIFLTRSLLPYKRLNHLRHEANFNDPALPQFTYATDQALFAADAPYRLLARSESYFIHPDKDYEKAGEVNEVRFVEGLVYFRDKWFLYYGTADSKIAAAVYDSDSQ